MGEHTLKVPAEHFEEFRLAAMAEVGMGGEWVKSAQEELSDRCVTSGLGGDKDALADVRCASRHLGEDMAILEQLVPRPHAKGRCIEVHGQPYALAHVAETMARAVVEPRIASEVNISPIDAEFVANLADLTEALGWAAGEAARLHALGAAERKAAKVEAA